MDGKMNSVNYVLTFDLQTKNHLPRVNPIFISLMNY